MASRFFLITFLLVILMTFFTLPSFASGIVTNTATQPGQVKTRNENGVMYLTTTTNPDGSTVSAYKNGDLPLTRSNILTPQGFARDFGSLLNSVLSMVMVISALLVFLNLILGGFEWITSGGDKGKTEKARQRITSAIIGLVIVAASYAVLNLVIRFLGFSSLNEVLQNVRPLDGSSPYPVVSPTPSPTPTPTPVL